MANLANNNNNYYYNSIVIRFLLLPLTFAALLYHSSAQHIVRTLPGYNGTLPFTLETGYVGIGENGEIQLFYYFIESEGNPEKDPLILWLTGGPGCSGLCSIVYEIGPIHFNDPVDDDDKKLPTLRDHPFSWTQNASFIFIDAPVETGFSYTTFSDYKFSNDQNAGDNYQFLRNWLVAHPRFSNNPVYICGDSFGGAIVPIVAHLISKGIEVGDKPSINLKGYCIGDPVTDIHDAYNSRVPFAYIMALLSKEQYELIKNSCKGEYVNPDPKNSICLTSLQIYEEVTSGINKDNILEPSCSDDEDLRSSKRNMEEISTYNMLKLSPDDFKPKCDQEKLSRLSRLWANDPAVQEAIHVRKGTLKTEWQRCKKDLTYEYDNDVIDYHRMLTATGYRALVYSGDHDMTVPYFATLNWISKLNLTIYEQWRPWFVDEQVAGFTQKYKNDRFDMTFATIKGAGHLPPETKFEESLRMFQRWISSEEL